ncbi:hypothetical protein F5B22DRAFT_657004 [Xylaria bambusicola]|uniref:uncharacterized protein n=1 Tax=Xylaria bambusicola TaxID=326684 RepID=UPI0020073829|nr:uncharacterized protein F5B22DRAFT_657004 [Xylaria bambusicola]KAI0513306.1 hypothetical protein F5B22DRAFT_657004 [Xylaria bambusicola]
MGLSRSARYFTTRSHLSNPAYPGALRKAVSYLVDLSAKGYPVLGKMSSLSQEDWLQGQVRGHAQGNSPQGVNSQGGSSQDDDALGGVFRDLGAEEDALLADPPAWLKPIHLRWRHHYLRIHIRSGIDSNDPPEDFADYGDYEHAKLAIHTLLANPPPWLKKIYRWSRQQYLEIRNESALDTLRLHEIVNNPPPWLQRIPKEHRFEYLWIHRESSIIAEDNDLSLEPALDNLNDDSIDALLANRDQMPMYLQAIKPSCQRNYLLIHQARRAADLQSASSRPAVPQAPSLVSARSGVITLTPSRSQGGDSPAGGSQSGDWQSRLLESWRSLGGGISHQAHHSNL